MAVRKLRDKRRPSGNGWAGDPSRRVKENKNGRVGPNNVITAPNGEGVKAVELPPTQDTALRLIQDIGAHRIDPRDLGKEQRKACLLLLANGSQTAAELAATFKVKTKRIRDDIREIREEVGREVRAWTLEQVLGQLSLVSDKTSAQAMKANDPGLAWTIQRDFAKLLKEFGVVGPERSRDSMTITIEQIGAGYDRARKVLSRALDPRLTGAVEEEDEDPVKALPLRPTLTGEQVEDNTIDAESTPSVPADE